MTKVAIIDDEVQILGMIEKFLRKDPEFSVVTYSNPVTALSSISNDVDVVLLDIMMPEMNGLDVLEKLTEKYPDIKIIMMTAYSTLDKVLSAHRHGAVDYIMKPFSSMNVITDKIESMVK